MPKQLPQNVTAKLRQFYFCCYSLISFDSLLFLHFRDTFFAFSAYLSVEWTQRLIQHRSLLRFYDNYECRWKWALAGVIFLAVGGMRNPFVNEMKAVCYVRQHLIFNYSPFCVVIQAFGAIRIFLVNNQLDISVGILMERSELTSFDQNRSFDLFLCVVLRVNLRQLINSNQYLKKRRIQNELCQPANSKQNTRHS